MIDAHIRLARLEDIPALDALIAASARGLQAQDYTPGQIEAALGAVFGVDRQLIADGAYHLAEVQGRIVACGGWSRRRTLYGADAVEGRDDSLLDPRADSARIRAFFVAPEFARQGLGSRLVKVCESAAMAAGFTSFELSATLTGVGLYLKEGYVPQERSLAPLPDGGGIEVVRMTKAAPPTSERRDRERS